MSRRTLGSIRHPGAIGVVSQATQAALEAETNEDTYAPPDLIQHSPGVAKVWVDFQINGTINVSKNVSSITDTGTGNWTVNFTTSFSGTSYAALATVEAESGSGGDDFTNTDTKAADSCGVQNFDGGTNSAKDPSGDVSFVAFGDQ